MNLFFYEIKDKRHGLPTSDQLAQLTPEAKSYLLTVLDTVKMYDSKYQRLGKFLHPDNNKELTSEDELISYLSSMYFAGFDRPSILGKPNKPIQGLKLPQPPSQEVVNSIINFAKARKT
jgi:hypothetical protein